MICVNTLKEQINIFFANDIYDANKKTAIFLTVIGSDTYSHLRNLLAPVSLPTKTVKELFNFLKEHLKLQPIFIADRLRSYCRDQNEKETISDYIAMLRKLTLNSNFSQFLDDALRERFVCGLRKCTLQALKTATDLAKILKSAEDEAKLINRGIKAENVFTIKQKSRICYRCNQDGNLVNTCPAKQYVCITCKMKGHLACRKACRKGNRRDVSRTQMVTPRKRT